MQCIAAYIQWALHMVIQQYGVYCAVESTIWLNINAHVFNIVLGYSCYLWEWSHLSSKTASRSVISKFQWIFSFSGNQWFFYDWIWSLRIGTLSSLWNVEHFSRTRNSQTVFCIKKDYIKPISPKGDLNWWHFDLYSTKHWDNSRQVVSDKTPEPRVSVRVE